MRAPESARGVPRGRNSSETRRTRYSSRYSRTLTYDGRLVRVAQITRDPSIATRQGVPASTAKESLRQAPPHRRHGLAHARQG